MQGAAVEGKAARCIAQVAIAANVEHAAVERGAAGVGVLARQGQLAFVDSGAAAVAHRTGQVQAAFAVLDQAARTGHIAAVGQRGVGVGIKRAITRKDDVATTVDVAGGVQRAAIKRELACGVAQILVTAYLQHGIVADRGATSVGVRAQEHLRAALDGHVALPADGALELVVGIGDGQRVVAQRHITLAVQRDDVHDRSGLGHVQRTVDSELLRLVDGTIAGQCQRGVLVDLGGTGVAVGVGQRDRTAVAAVLDDQRARNAASGVVDLAGERRVVAVLIDGAGLVVDLEVDIHVGVLVDHQRTALERRLVFVAELIGALGPIDDDWAGRGRRRGRRAAARVGRDRTKGHALVEGQTGRLVDEKNGAPQRIVQIHCHESQAVRAGRADLVRCDLPAGCTVTPGGVAARAEVGGTEQCVLRVLVVHRREHRGVAEVDQRGQRGIVVRLVVGRDVLPRHAEVVACSEGQVLVQPRCIGGRPGHRACHQRLACSVQPKCGCTRGERVRSAARLQ